MTGIRSYPILGILKKLGLLLMIQGN